MNATVKKFVKLTSRKLFFVLLLLSSAISIFAQNSSITEIQKLNQQVFALNSEGKLDEAISLAEKIVEMEDKAKSLNSQSYAVLLDNLVKLKEKRIKQNQSILNSDKSSKSEQNRALKQMKKDAQNAEELFNRILKIYDDELKIETVHSASVKRAFANFLYQYAERSYDAGRFYSEAISSYKKLLGENDKNTLSTTLELAKYYFENGKLEESLVLFERYIETVNKYHGEKSQWLVPALRYYAVILVTIDLEDDAEKVVSQITEITGKTEKLEDKLLDISSRSLDSRITVNMGRLRNSTGVGLSPEAVNEARLQNADVIPSNEGSVMSRTNIIYNENAVKVLVDENGKVIEAKSLSENKNVAERAENAVMKWKFKVFVYKGKARRLRGVVLYKDKLN